MTKEARERVNLQRFPEQDLTLDILINDVGRWITYAKEARGFKKIGLIGHDQGALIANIAALDNDIDSYVSISGTALTLDKTIEDNLRKTNQPDSVLLATRIAFEELGRSDTTVMVPTYLMPIFRPSVQGFMKSWLAYDPLVEIFKLNMPVLIIQGDSDLQVTTDESTLLHAASKQSELLIIEGMNHIMKEVGDVGIAANMETYSRPDLKPPQKIFC